MTTRRCPICEQSYDSDASPALPFCSQRCRLIDLGRWLDEDYSLPHESPEESFDDEQ